LNKKIYYIFLIFIYIYIYIYIYTYKFKRHVKDNEGESVGREINCKNRLLYDRLNQLILS